MYRNLVNRRTNDSRYPWPEKWGAGQIYPQNPETVKPLARSRSASFNNRVTSSAAHRLLMSNPGHKFAEGFPFLVDKFSGASPRVAGPRHDCIHLPLASTAVLGLLGIRSRKSGSFDRLTLSASIRPSMRFFLAESMGGLPDLYIQFKEHELVNILCVFFLLDVVFHPIGSNRRLPNS
jgi:hypothetical protein